VTLPHLDRCMVGGTALPPAVQKAFKDVHGVRVVHLWGVTETSPVRTIGAPTAEVLVILPLDGQQPTSEEILEFLAPHMAKWWLPDDVVFVKEMPMTATGRILKAKLREQHWHHLAG